MCNWLNRNKVLVPVAFERYENEDFLAQAHCVFYRIRSRREAIQAKRDSRHETWKKKLRKDRKNCTNEKNECDIEWKKMELDKSYEKTYMCLLQVGQALAMRCRCRAPDFDTTGRTTKHSDTYTNSIVFFKINLLAAIDETEI